MSQEMLSALQAELNSLRNVETSLSLQLGELQQIAREHSTSPHYQACKQWSREALDQTESAIQAREKAVGSLVKALDAGKANLSSKAHYLAANNLSELREMEQRLTQRINSIVDASEQEDGSDEAEANRVVDAFRVSLLSVLSARTEYILTKGALGRSDGDERYDDSTMAIDDLKSLVLSEARKFHSGRKKLKHTINETVGTIADQTAVELARQHIMLANAQYTLERRTQKAGQWRKVLPLLAQRYARNRLLEAALRRESASLRKLAKTISFLRSELKADIERSKERLEQLRALKSSEEENRKGSEELLYGDEVPPRFRFLKSSSTSKSWGETIDALHGAAKDLQTAEEGVNSHRSAWLEKLAAARASLHDVSKTKLAPEHQVEETDAVNAAEACSTFLQESKAQIRGLKQRFIQAKETDSTDGVAPVNVKDKELHTLFLGAPEAFWENMNSLKFAVGRSRG